MTKNKLMFLTKTNDYQRKCVTQTRMWLQRMWLQKGFTVLNWVLNLATFCWTLCIIISLCVFRIKYLINLISQCCLWMVSCSLILRCCVQYFFLVPNFTKKWKINFERKYSVTVLSFCWKQWQTSQKNWNSFIAFGLWF